ncbi:MAG: D-glycerate dehydrogenase [Acidobacteriota bacterium]|nr:D-glycerate dehydrogenase [Acidobacteriota bacterium]
MPSVVITRRLPASVLSPLESIATVDTGPAEGWPQAELIARAASADAIISQLTDRIDRAVIDAAPSLKVIANVAVGYDNIDIAAARERGIIVTNTPDVLTNAVAEFTWAMILAVTRRVAEGDRAVRRGAWKGWALDYMPGMELAGKQLGLVGRGRIGRAVAAKAAAFGMRVVFAKHDVSLDELLVTSDVISLHVPLTDGTRHLIDRKSLVRMKRSAYLVNTSRGQVVDEEALAWALHEGLLAGAALDVYEREPAVHPDLLTHENVVLAPHIGSATRETRTAMAELAVRNVIEVLAGRPAVTPVS